MKTTKFTLVKTAVVVGLLIGLSSAALARPRISVTFGSGRSSFSVGYRNTNRRGSFKTPRCNLSRNRNRKWGSGRLGCRPRRRVNISRSVYLYDRGLGYCVAIPPMVIEKQTVVVSTSSPQAMQPVEFDESTIALNKNLQYKKSELLKQLQAPDKEQRMEAIKELAGFSFDDKVKQTLENILLSDPDAELRKEAARSFGKVKNTKALPALEKARVEDTNEDVRKAADEAIKSILGN